MSVFVRAPSNIALIKYWGKSDIKYNLPLNSSISLTIDISKIHTETSLKFQERGLDLTLNSKKEEPSARLLNLIKLFNHDIEKQGICINSVNNFPSAAGMASSASGFAALTLGLSKLLKSSLSLSELTVLARQGSGSACRSLHGGVVEWVFANQSELSFAKQSELSFAKQLYPSDYWPQLSLISLVVSSEKKKVLSTTGMTQNNPKIAERAFERVPERISRIKEAFSNKNFPEICQVTMEDSDDMHSAIEFGGIQYMNEKSKLVQEIVRDFNRNEVRAGYTFDAGPNPFVVIQRKDVTEFTKKLLAVFKLASFADMNLYEDFEQGEFEDIQRQAKLEAISISQLKVSDKGAYIS